MSRTAGRGVGGQPAALTQDLSVVALPSPGSIHEASFCSMKVCGLGSEGSLGISTNVNEGLSPWRRISVLAGRVGCTRAPVPALSPHRASFPVPQYD